MTLDQIGKKSIFLLLFIKHFTYHFWSFLKVQTLGIMLYIYFDGPAIIIYFYFFQIHQSFSNLNAIEVALEDNHLSILSILYVLSRQMLQCLLADLL